MKDKTKKELTDELAHLRRLYAHRKAGAAQIRAALWAMNSSEDIGTFLKTFFEVTQELCPALVACSATVLNAEQNVGTAYWFTKQTIKKFSIDRENLAGSPVERSWRHREIVYRPDLQHQDLYGELALFGPSSTVRCILDVPYENGTLAVSSSQPNAFSTDDIEMLQETSSLLSEAFKRIEDIQALADKEIQLRESQKIEALGQLAAGIAHNFNNALLVIMGNVDLTLYTASDEQRSLLQEANRSAQRAADIVDQLMVYAHHGKPAASEPVNIYKVAEEVVNICRNTFDRKIAISLEGSTRLTTLGHAGDLQQMLLNLCINARDALEEAALETPELHIRLDKVKIDTPPDDSTTPGGYFVRIDLSDNGVGMDAQTQSHIFDPFFTTKEVGKGTGLGLSTTYSIIHQHNGWIQCRSTLGQGTTFTFFLPLALPTPSAIKKEQEQEQQPRQGGKETILLVDDEEGVRRAVSILLDQLGYSILTSNDGREALEIFETHRDNISLILLDQSMPHMSGREALQAIRAIDPDIAVIIFTGQSVKRSDFPNIQDLIKKPIRLQELSNKVRQVLDS